MPIDLNSGAAMNACAKYRVGQLILHRLFEYRGVVFNVDAEFEGTPQWYEQVARSRPPKDEPWYHVLPHGAGHTTYVAERNLRPDRSGSRVDHPLIDDYFASYTSAGYVMRQPLN